MGIKHLKNIENLLKKSNKSVTLTFIKESLGIEWYTLKDCINYLIDKDIIGITYVGKRVLYHHKKTI